MIWFPISPLPPDTRSVQEIQLEKPFYNGWNSSSVVEENYSPIKLPHPELFTLFPPTIHSSSSIVEKEIQIRMLPDELDDSWVFKPTPAASFKLKVTINAIQRGKPIVHFLDSLDEGEY